MIQGLVRNPKVIVGLVVFGLFILMAAAGPPFVNHLWRFSAQSIDYAHLHAAPDRLHPLGTTSAGQDVLAQLVFGARGSVAVGITSGLIAIGLGVVVGVSSGFIGGLTDNVLTVITNLFLTMPSFAMILIVAGYLQGASWVVIALLIGIFEWPGGARYLRSQTLTLRNRDFAMAARIIGETRWRLIFAEVLPHLIGIVSAMFLRAIVAGIFAEAGLDFLGIGSANTISWGTMISVAQDQNAMVEGYWWWYAPPGLCIALIGTATALVNFGIDEITNPKLRTANRAMVRRFERTRRRRLRSGTAQSSTVTDEVSA